MQTSAQRFITRWDLDKTYLRSHFDTLSELVRSALEKVDEKRTVPGATAVLRALGAGGGRVHILSGSPRQMRSKLEAKLRLDGVGWDELTLKPNLSNLLHMRLSALRDQLGYKLPELLAARARDEQAFGTSARIREVLVGDDSEADAFVYSLYADLCAGNVGTHELARVLEAGELRRATILRAQAALASLTRGAVIDCILIHLDGQTPPSLFLRYGPRLVPFYNYWQAALVLLERGFLSEEGALGVALEFTTKHGFSADALARSYQDLLRRGHATRAAPRLLEARLATSELPLGTAERGELSAALEGMRREPPAAAPLSRPPRLDYVELAVRHRGGRNRRRPGQPFG